MVGSQSNQAGSMRDGEHEAVSGARIDEVYKNLDRSSAFKPNVILVNAGTNDCQQNFQLDGAINRLSDLLKKAWDQSSQATIILSTLVMSTNEAGNPGIQARVSKYNEGVRNRFISKDDLSDNIHPTNDGYRKMAAVWNEAIERARAQGMLQDPEDNGTPDGACPKVPGKGDGPYKHHGTYIDRIIPRTYTFKGRDSSKRFSFAQVVNYYGDPDPKGALDDFVYWEKTDNNGLKLHYSVNRGNGDFDEDMTVDLPFDCPSDDIRWADIDGDFNDDYVCVQSNGDLRVAINTGAHSDDHKPAFKELEGFSVPTHTDYEGRQVRLGDIDGDGKADYCLTSDDGFIRCWRNAEQWQDLGVVFTPKGKGDIRGTRFVDINGDGRWDWIWVGDAGDTDIYTNIKIPGSESSAAPMWLRAENFHGGMGKAGVRDEIYFARIFGTDHAGRRDYIWFEATDKGDDNFDFTPRVWRNDGSGGTQGYCDERRR
ncbi:Glucan endo-1,3-alpha-glucosidase agn1 [Kalmusia sp. IMI 367209]|nr:Glucan endo-1,3-alpha-glucosidase agn1 [Kalmusia sp. IMI 367209]